MRKKVFTKIQLNALMAIVGASMLISGAITTFATNLYETAELISLIIVVFGLVFVIIAGLVRVESNDERSRENADRAGNYTTLVMQFILTFLAAVCILFKDYVRDYFNSNTIFILLGILIFTRSVAFIKYEKAGE